MIGRLDLRSRAQGGRDVAGRFCNRARLLARRDETVQHVCGRDIGVRAFVPRNFQRFAALHGGPGTRRDDNYAAGSERAFSYCIDREHFGDTRNRLGSCGVEFRGLAAKDGATRDDGVREIVGTRVDAEFRGAGGFGARFETIAVAADDGEIADPLSQAVSEMALFPFSDCSSLRSRTET